MPADSPATVRPAVGSADSEDLTAFVYSEDLTGDSINCVESAYSTSGVGSADSTSVVISEDSVYTVDFSRLGDSFLYKISL